MPESFDIQDVEPEEETLQVILGALTRDAGTQRWPSPPKSTAIETRSDMSSATLGWAEDAEPPGANASAEMAVADTTADADVADADVADADEAVADEAVADATPGASVDEVSRRTGRSGVWLVRAIKRHRGTSVLAAGAVVALAGGAVLGGWAKPVSVSLPGTHAILVDPSAHSDGPPGRASTPSTALSPATTSPVAPPSTVANASTGAADPVPAPSPPSSTSPVPDPSQVGSDGSASTSSPAGASSTGPTSDASSSDSGTTAPPSTGSSSGSSPSGGGTAPTSPPPATPPSGGPGSSGLAGVLSGLLGPVIGSN